MDSNLLLQSLRLGHSILITCAIEGDLGFRHLQLALEIVDLEGSIELFGFDTKLDLLKLCDFIFALDLDVIQLGQSRIQGCLGSGDAQCIALVELLVLKDQLLEIAFLLLELPFQTP